MEIRQLTALVAVADHGSFSAAAKALFTVQSNISAHVARLEKELGVTLVDRTRGCLTDEGEVVVSRARRVQQELNALVTDLASRGAEVTGDVRIGVIGSTARWLVPALLEGLRRRHPGVRAIVVEGSTTSLVPQLEAGMLELAVINLPVEGPELSAEVLFEEEMLLVVPVGHPLHTRERVTIADLDGHPLLLGPPGTALRDDLDDEAARAGIRLRAQAEIDGVRLISSLVVQGLGAAVLPATAVPGQGGERWVRVPVEGLRRRQVGLARRRRSVPSAPARALAALVWPVVERLGPDQPGVHLTGADTPGAD
jgi:LysR family hydrogen peroxide-inducible transcriptional activator